MSKIKGFTQRLRDGDTIVVAEGYLFELESRGYLKAGAYVPDAVLDAPDKVKELHREFVRAGSDVVLALMYYTNREKMKTVGRESELEDISKKALEIARQVADETGTLMAGNLSNTNIIKKEDPATHQKAFDMFTEQIQWTKEFGVDFIVAETLHSYLEASLALKACKQLCPDVPVVVTFALHGDRLQDGIAVDEACRRMEEEGAAVVGLNCTRGPKTMLPLLRDIRRACKGPLAALPVPYRTSDKFPTFQSLPEIDHEDGNSFPLDLDAWLCGRKQMRGFTEEARRLGVQYLGVCCGNRPHFIREMALAVGHEPASAKYVADLSKHYSRLSDSTSAVTIQKMYSF